MKILLSVPLSILLLFLLIGCKGGKNGLEHIENTYNDGSIQESYYVDDNGKLQGEYLAFYEDGTPYRKENYKDSLKDGYSLLYYQDGTVKSNLKYDKGVLIDTARMYNNYGKVTEIEVRNKKGKLMSRTKYDLKNLGGTATVYHTPSEKIIAWQTFNVYNIALDSVSNYLQVKYKDWTIAQLVPHAPNMDKVDSAYVHVIESMDFISGEPIKATRSVKYRNVKKMIFEVLDEDYVDGYHVNLVVVTYAKVNGELVVNEFPVQGNKSRRLPKTNMYPLN